jgi:hypothetical protein
MKTQLTRWITTALAALIMMLCTSQTWANDLVVLKDGTKLEGEIVREVSGAIWLKTNIGGLETTQFYAPTQIERIERASDRPAPETPVASREAQAQSKARSGATRIAVITLEGMVGTYMAAKPLIDAVPLLEEEDIDVVVIKFNSGGGALIEIEPLQRAIIEYYKPRFQVVSWVESAISAAAMTSHVIEDIYFMDQGNYGACTGFFGASLVAMDGRDLEEVLFMMEKASREGGYDYRIMRAMQIEEPLSATIDEYGQVEWFLNEQGDYLVNPQGRILTFNSQSAKKFGFSRGTVNTIDELARAMGYTEYEFVGETVPGVIHPVSKAERSMRNWRASIETSERRMQEFMVKYNISVANAEGAQDRRERGTFIGLARQHLAQIVRSLRAHPNLALFQLGALPEQADEWIYQQNRMLDELARRD